MIGDKARAAAVEHGEQKEALLGNGVAIASDFAAGSFLAGVAWARENPGWIPVSERLPSEPGGYDVTMIGHDGVRTTGRQIFNAGPSGVLTWKIERARVGVRVLAWKEFAEPYEEEDR